MSLGPSTVLTCEQARTRAITIIAATRNGEDPAAKRDADRQAITVKELADRFDKRAHRAPPESRARPRVTGACWSA